VSGQLNVLYLTFNPNRASTTSPTEGWFKHLRPRGLNPVLVSHRTGAFHAWAVQQGIPAYHVPLPWPKKWYPFPFLRSLWRLRRLVRRHHIDIIHCNEQNIYPTGQYLGRLCGLPVVVSVHCTIEAGFCRWAFGGVRRPRRVFFISRGSREACRPGMAGVVPEDRWRLLPNGLDLDHYRAEEDRGAEFRWQHALNGELLVGAACALRPGKQLEHLVEVVARLNRADVKLALAGGPVPGDETYARDLLDQARTRLGERFLYLGHRDELRGLYNALDLCVNTSREEACSISILEALACGCPVLGYPSKSVDEQVLPGGGEMVAQDDVAGLTAALGRWLADRNRLKAARPGARRRVEEDYDIRRLGDQLWDEYQRLVEECSEH
jgi:glycosyltransferase involved in cell wall biosynthesis